MKSLTEYIKESGIAWWHGVEGARVIDHGQWSDPEIEWDGECYNYWEVEEFVAEELDLMDLYKEDSDKFNEEVSKRPEDVRKALIEFASIHAED